MVDDLKALGWPPERVIVAVKKIATEAGLHPTHGALTGIAPVFEHEAVIAQTVRIGIERYYYPRTSDSP